MTQHQPTTLSSANATVGIQQEQRYSGARGITQHSQTDDDEWEDEDIVQDSEKASGRQINPGDNASLHGSPRKRRKQFRGPRRQIPPPSPKQIPATPRLRPLIDVILKGALDGTIFIGRYALDVFSAAIHLLRWPISIFLFLWLLSSMIGYITQTVRNAFQPLCIIPGMSMSSMCRVNNDLNNNVPIFTPKWADYPKLVEVQSKTFEQLLEESVGGPALSLEIKKAEMATSDLVTRVRISDLKAKDTLAESLGEFLEDAKNTGRGLHKLTSKVGGAVDSIMAVNDYALQSIKSARANEPSPWSPRALAIWKPARPNTKEVIMKTFEEAMSVLSVNMGRLIVEAEHSLHNLKTLEGRLVTLHEVVSREDSSISSAKTELLEELWTKLGGNQKGLRNFDHHLKLLKGLSVYRRQALMHVVAALETLRAMSDDMEDMRERVAAPDLVGSNVPVEVHMKSISMGLERLREGRIRAKRLEADAVKRVLSMEDH